MRIFRYVAAALLTSSVSLLASDNLTEGGDAGRTGWMRNDKVVTTSNVRDLKLVWKASLDSVPRQMHNLFPPLIAERLTTARAPREVAIVVGVNDDLFAIDVASGEQLWKTHFASTFQPAPDALYHTLCPGGQTANGARLRVRNGTKVGQSLRSR
jgi:hypothetical protein